jgi:SAM-dependent methyltransferase
MAPAFEAKGAAEHRAELLVGLVGRVIEVGAGTGLNFKHYPQTVTEVVALEPEPHLREVARAAATEAPVPVTVVEGTADDLPADDAAFDAGVASLVLCSVPSQPRALAELSRVIRPGASMSTCSPRTRGGQPDNTGWPRSGDASVAGAIPIETRAPRSRPPGSQPSTVETSCSPQAGSPSSPHRTSLDAPGARERLPVS